MSDDDVDTTAYTNFEETQKCQDLLEGATIVKVIVQAPIPAQVFIIEKDNQWHFIEIRPSKFVGLRELSRKKFVNMFGPDMLGDIVAKHINGKLKKR